MSYQDLSFNLYSLKVMLGWPRVLKQIDISENGRYQLLEDTKTGQKFIGPLEYISAGIHPGSYLPAVGSDWETYGFTNS